VKTDRLAVEETGPGTDFLACGRNNGRIYSCTTLFDSVYIFYKNILSEYL